MNKFDEITVVKYETEFVATHKVYDVIGVGGNEFEAVLELSKALGALMCSKDVKAQKEHELLGLKNKMINAYQSHLASIFKLQKEINTKEKEIEEMK